MADGALKCSVIIPAHNEVDSIAETVESTVTELERAEIDYEIIVIDDPGGDRTGEVVRAISMRCPRVQCVRSRLPPGFGHAVRAGLEVYTGDAVAIMMADLSARPRTWSSTTACWSWATTARSGPASDTGAARTITRA